MDISFLISTNRPELANVVIDYINKIGHFEDYQYEICVFSPNNFSQKNVVNFRDSGGGPLYGFNLMAQRSKGQYLYVLADDNLPAYNLFDAVNFLKSNDFLCRKNGENRKIHVTTLRSDSPCWIPQEPLPNNTKDLVDSKTLMLRWPVFTRDTLHDHLNGHIFHPRFIYHWADNYLSWFINKTEEPIECNIKLYGMRNNNKYNDIFDEKDYNVFRELINNFSGNYV